MMRSARRLTLARQAQCSYTLSGLGGLRLTERNHSFSRAPLCSDSLSLLQIIGKLGRDGRRSFPSTFCLEDFDPFNAQNLLSALPKLRRYRDTKRRSRPRMAGFDGPDRRAGRWGASTEGATQFRRTASTLTAVARDRNENNDNDAQRNRTRPKRKRKQRQRRR